MSFLHFKTELRGNYDPIRDMIDLPTKIPGISFPFVCAPLALYDAPSMFRAIWSHDMHDMATATTMNILPFGHLTKDILKAYQAGSMAAYTSLPGTRFTAWIISFTKGEKNAA